MAAPEAPAAAVGPPDLARLTAALCEVLGGPVTVLHRTPCPRSSTAASEILTCRLPDGATVRLRGKYGADDARAATYGHKGGVPFEAVVYREILPAFRDCTVPFRGAHGEGETWLFCDYLADVLHLHKVDDALALGARWAGCFHRANEGRRPPLLGSYDRPYFLGWAERTARFAGDLKRDLPWLTPLCDRFTEAADLLLAAPQTVIHGEFYPLNILASGRKVYPIDWESAAVAAGEIDLACLTEGWADEDVAACERLYQDTRWPGRPTHPFERSMAAARAYVALRWLGERPEYTQSEDRRDYFRQLRLAGERLGLI